MFIPDMAYVSPSIRMNSQTISKLETIFCVFPAENSFVNALVPFIGVKVIFLIR